MDDYIIRLVTLPTTVRGFVTVDSDGNPNIYINARLTEEERQRTYLHEVKHITRGDLNNDLPIQMIEGL